MMLEAESTYQANVQQLVKKHSDRLAFLLDGFVNLRSSSEIEPWMRKRRMNTRIILSCIFIFIVLYFIPTIEKNYSTILAFLRQGVWWILSGCFLLLIAAFPFVLLLIRRSLLESRTIPDKALELRAMLDNDQLVPLVINQPPILSEDKLPVASTRIGLKRWKTDAVLRLMGATTPIVGVLTTVLPQLSFQRGAGSPSHEFIFSVVYLFLLILFCGGVCLMALVFTWQAYRSAEVMVDAYGLRWHRPGWSRESHASIAWDDVQGFYVFIYKELDSIYFLDGREATFVWSTNHDNPTDLLNASDRLSSLIVTQTHLALRDLSMAVATQLIRPE
jgi:hypothetical protein